MMLMASLFAFGQDVHFAQLSETPLLLNPSLAGSYDGFYRGQLLYRNQWPALGKAYNTVYASADAPFNMKKREGGIWGLGLFLYSDKAGDGKFGTMQADGTISANLPVSDKARFSSGIQVGIMQHSVDLNAIQWPNQYNGFQYDATLPSNENPAKNSFLVIDLGAGVNYQYSTSSSTFTGKEQTHFNIGLSMVHPSAPLQKFYAGSKERQYRRIALHSTLRKDIEGTKLGVVPSLLFMLEGPAMEIFLGSFIRYKLNEGTKVTNFYSETAISAGLFYRFKDAISPQVQLELGDIAFGISYDINVSSLSQAQRSAGGLELSIRYANMRGAARKPKGL